MTFPFVAENNSSRLRLERLANSLTDEELGQAVPSGWTVAALLAHIAFWDQRVVALLRRWKEQGLDESPVDSDAMNEAIKPLCLALNPRKAVALCLSSAAAADAELETVSPELLAQIQTNPTHFRFNRALHRNDHLDEIERLIRP